MSKKRPSPESSDEGQTNEEGADLVVSSKGEDNAKRAHLDSPVDTTLEDLPIEILECILLKAVVMEVREMKLTDRVWKTKADLAIVRLGSVCPRWNSVLTTNFFRREVHRILDGIAPETILLDIVHEFPLKIFVIKATTMKDEMFLLCRPNGQDYVINVYDRNNMWDVKDVIPLPGVRPKGMEASTRSNCVYVLDRKPWLMISVLCIKRDGDQRFTVSAWRNLWLPNPTMSVSDDGGLILSRQVWKNPIVVRIYGANGSLQHQLSVSARITSVSDIIPKPNGNLVLVSVNRDFGKQLTEIDTKGTVLRLYRSPIIEYRGVSRADIYGRMLITDRLQRIVLLDSELNTLEFSLGLHEDERWLLYPYKLHYSNDRNEILSFVEYPKGSRRSLLTIFSFTEKENTGKESNSGTKCGLLNQFLQKFCCSY